MNTALITVIFMGLVIALTTTVLSWAGRRHEDALRRHDAAGAELYWGLRCFALRATLWLCAIQFCLFMGIVLVCRQ